MTGNTDTHKTMGGGGGVNPRRSMPYNPYAMAAAGIAVVGGVWYMYNRNNKADRVPESDDTRRPK